MPAPDLPGAAGEPSFDRYARLVRTTLGVPIALVSIVESDRQVFPGAAGLAEPLATERFTPLTHSFCQYVVADAAPLVVGDARTDPRLADNAAITDIGVIAYAGYPLRVDGRVVGSLCAIDTVARVWDPAELVVLEDLAAACSSELELRGQRLRAEEAEHVARTANESAKMLLSLSESLADTRTLTDVATALHRIAVEELGALHAGIWLVDGSAANHVENPADAWAEAGGSSFALDNGNPIGSAVLGGVPVFHSGIAEQEVRYPRLVTRGQRDDGEGRMFLPLQVMGEALGCLVIVWPGERAVDEAERLTIGTLTAYTAQAVQRAILLHERATVAATLQNAMLTTLPCVPGLDLVARYRTAAEQERVGGDWYDVIACPDGRSALVIGDVVGHDIAAAAVMGQLRSMLRAFVWEGSGGPADLVERLDRAGRDFVPGALATTVVALLDHRDGPASLRWTNAGHPAPVVLGPDGRCTSLDGVPIDCLLGPFPATERHDHDVAIEPGSTLLLFTDGLIEARTRDLDAGRAELIAAVERRCGGSLDELVDGVLSDLVGPHPADDVAVLGVRLTVRAD